LIPEILFYLGKKFEDINLAKIEYFLKWNFNKFSDQEQIILLAFLSLEAKR